MVQFRIYQKTDSDCFQCCVASIMGWDYYAVPDFFSGERGNRKLTPRGVAKMDRWFSSHDLVLLRFPVPVPTLFEVMQVMRETQSPDVTYIVTGQTVKGVGHAVICSTNKVVHDPARPSQPLSAPHENGAFMTYFVGLK